MSNSEFGSISFDLQKIIKCNQSSSVVEEEVMLLIMFKQGIKELILLFVIRIHSFTKQFSAEGLGGLRV
jgi:hypothetical protein